MIKKTRTPTLHMSLSSRPIVEYPFAPNELKLGYELSDRKNANTYLALSLLKGRTAFVSLAQAYGNSFLEAPTKTVLHYRDYLISKALDACLVNMQYVDLDKTQLTGHSEKVWNSFSYNDIWPYTEPTISKHIETYKYADLLGSLAHHLIGANASNQPPLFLLEKLLRYIWGLVGTSYDLLPAERISYIFKALRLDSPLLVDIEQRARTAYEEESTFTYVLRRQGLELDLFDRLPLQVLLGAYSSELLAACSSFLSEQDNKELSSLLYGPLTVLKPCGTPLLLQALVVEGYLRAAKLLNTLDEKTLLQDVEVFHTDPQYSIARRRLAQYLALTYDSYNFLDAFSSFQYARQRANEVKLLVMYWLTASDTTLLPKSGRGRLSLGSLLPAVDISTEDPIDIGDPVLFALQQQPPKGKTEELILLKTDRIYGKSINITATDIFGVPKEADLHTLVGDSNTVKITEESTGNYSVRLLSNDYVAFVAVPKGNRKPDLDTYLPTQE